MPKIIIVLSFRKYNIEIILLQNLFSIKYLIKHSYLGFRFHGWEQQPNMKTIEGMLHQTIRFLLGDIKFDTHVCSRTDARVSARANYCLLIIDQELGTSFKDEMNNNLPTDIRILDIKKVEDNFNIRSSVNKTYNYLLSNQAIDPYFASIIHSEPKLNMDVIKSGIKLFEGEHDFIAYSSHREQNKQSICTIKHAAVLDGTRLPINFDGPLYTLSFTGDRFLYNQIRLMVARLIQLGLGEISEDDIKADLSSDNPQLLRKIAPASGLHLMDVKFR